jgi:hypothetical protein
MLVVPGAVGVPGDPTPPLVTPHLFGTLGSNGWYTSNVTLNWTYTDPESVITSTSGCETVTFSADSPGISRTCTAISDGGTAAITKTVKLDKTPPATSGTPARGPDANGWYNRPVGITFSGADATSLVASCSSAGYGGPDNPAVVMGGTCVDNAGNVATAAVSFKYDATAPTLFAVTSKTGNRVADVAWRMSSDTSVVEVFRAPGRNGQGETAVYRGTGTVFHDTALVPGRKYEYRVAAVDQASNRAETTVHVTATGALFSPLPGAVVAAPPTLSWAPVKRASYYNVLLMRGRKVFSAWPARTSLRLPIAWTYKGRRYRLRPGVYRWYVWPGFGRVTAGRYGRLIGGSTFVFRT